MADRAPKILWEKGGNFNAQIHRFTVGNDHELDARLVYCDILGTLAHVTMLNKIKQISDRELHDLKSELITLYHRAKMNELIIEEGVEDVHSQIEFMLTQKLSETGQKIHSGRSRNDQILVDIKLYIRDEIRNIVKLTDRLFKRLIGLSENYKAVLMPGYTHMQIAMPSSFGLWFGAYAESLIDDMIVIRCAYELVNKNPLGSAAGYGSSFPLDRQMTTKLLGFNDLHYNSVYAQMSRGKTERTVSQALATLAGTLSRLAMDIILYMGQNFGFISFPEELTTGSSIMPHKKNPDVFELIRARCNRIQAVPAEIILITANLPSGYHRDLQIMKDHFFQTFDDLKDCLEIMEFMLGQMQINQNILDDPLYDHLFSVEEVNKRVLTGLPFRQAYRQVAEQIKNGGFQPSHREITHTHIGSIGNLCNHQIKDTMKKIIRGFHFEKYERAIRYLLKK